MQKCRFSGKIKTKNLFLGRTVVRERGNMTIIECGIDYVSDLYVYSADGDFIARCKTEAQARKAARGYRDSFIVDVADAFRGGSKDSYFNSIMSGKFLIGF